LSQISPEELEEIILQNDKVLEACVFGISDPPGGGHIPKGLVVLKENWRHCDQKTIADEIESFVHG